MKEIKFLHLFSDILTSSGDSENLSYMIALTRQMGFYVTITRSNDPFEAAEGGYDLIYIADGSSRGLVAASRHFVRAATKINRAIDAGQTVVSIGSSRLLFGNGFVTADGKIGAGIGSFDYSGVGEREVTVCRNIGVPVFDGSTEIIGGVIRRFSMCGRNMHPLFRLKRGVSDGREYDGFEGTLYKNFFGTWQCDGAVIAENPPLMREILRRVLGAEYREPELSLATAAHNELKM
jgi:CobQ-like glutamine amidotransferase family enzyme